MTQGWPGMANTRQDLAAEAAELEKLAAELDGQAYALTLMSGHGRSHLHITNRRAPVLSERVYCEGDWFWWPWAERVAAVADLAGAVAAVDRVLQVLGGNR